MVAVYLYFNAALYVVFAAWCTIAARTTAKNLGFESLSNSGRSEYLVVYGGLQLGLAIAFGYCAMNSGMHRVGVLFALAVYAPLVVYRVCTVIAFRPVGTTTLAVGAFEALMLVVAALLWFTRLRGSAT